ncbi:MAG: ribosome silencing factor [Elusimicrobia bacterium]|nr:ribosome silencing factor [Elusimicrobiota bacterium]
MEETDYRSIAEDCVRVIDSKKGRDAVLYDVREMTGFTDYIIIATVDSGPQMQAVMKEMLGRWKKRPLHVEGDAAGGWVLVDFVGVVVNLFTPEVRAFYKLERLWGQADQVEIKL